jgi:hypothetical protein
MRRGTIVAAVTAGVLGAGASTASAAPLPITVDFTSGTVKVGSLPSATQTAPSRLTGTIETDTLVATFPQEGVSFAKATAGTLSVTPKAAGTITGRPNATTGSLDLSGRLTYEITGEPGACTFTPTAPVGLTGTPLNPADGAYGVSGSGSNAVVGIPSGGCLTYQGSAGLFTNTTLTYSGKLTIPGVIPPPSSVVVVTPPPTAPSTPTTPATPTAPATPTRPGALAVSVSKPKAVKRGRSTVTKVVVRNTGAGTARTVAVTLRAKGRGVTPRTVAKSYATIGAGKTRTFSVRLRSTKKAVKRSSVTVTAKGAGGLSASGATTLALR